MISPGDNAPPPRAKLSVNDQVIKEINIPTSGNIAICGDLTEWTGQR